jgi:hypothetical protein
MPWGQLITTEKGSKLLFWAEFKPMAHARAHARVSFLTPDCTLPHTLLRLDSHLSMLLFSTSERVSAEAMSGYSAAAYVSA